MKRIIILSIGIIMVCAFAFAGQNRGAKEMQLDAGSKRAVHFPHSDHQDRLKDCKICHSLFPQSAGAIKAMIKKGDMKKKHVMNKLCIKCHRANRKAGRAHGPLRCSKCHVRK